MQIDWATFATANYQRRVDADDAAADAFDRASQNAAIELTSCIERTLSQPDWINPSTTVLSADCFGPKGGHREVAEPAIDAFIAAMEADTVAPLLAALVASPAGAQLRRAIAQFHASVNADFVAKARGY
jgi:hypothetical protein